MVVVVEMNLVVDLYPAARLYLLDQEFPIMHYY